MPSSSPKTSEIAKGQLIKIGQLIREKRKALGISAIATSEASGISRVTLHRIEKGMASVTIGAYSNVLAALNLTFNLTEINNNIDVSKSDNKSGWIPVKIKLDEYPQLKQLAWHIQGVDFLSPIEALGIYERNARFIEEEKLTDTEKDLMTSLQIAFEGHKQ